VVPPVAAWAKGEIDFVYGAACGPHNLPPPRPAPHPHPPWFSVVSLLAVGGRKWPPMKRERGERIAL